MSDELCRTTTINNSGVCVNLKDFVSVYAWLGLWISVDVLGLVLLLKFLVVGQLTGADPEGFLMGGDMASAGARAYSGGLGAEPLVRGRGALKLKAF